MNKVLIAKQKSPKAKLWTKEFKSAVEAAHYLKVHCTTVHRACGKYGYKPFKVKGWYVDQLKDQ